MANLSSVPGLRVELLRAFRLTGMSTFRDALTFLSNSSLSSRPVEEWTANPPASSLTEVTHDVQ